MSGSFDLEYLRYKILISLSYLLALYHSIVGCGLVMLTLSILIYIPSILHLYSIYPHLYFIYTSYILHLYSLYTPSILHLYSIYTSSILHLYSIYTLSIFHLYSMYIVHIFFYLYIIYPLFIPNPPTILLLYPIHTT